MAKRFVHVSFNFKDGNNKTKELAEVFNRATDWYRYMPNCWILWTSTTIEDWYERIRPHIIDEDRFFIVEINISERQGWLSKSVWEWIKKPRSAD